MVKIFKELYFSEYVLFMDTPHYLLPNKAFISP